MKHSTFLLTLLCGLHGLLAQNFSNGYPWVMPYDDSTIQTFLPAFPKHPIQADEQVSIDAMGNFSISGEATRFWGVNITAAGCFPPKNLAPTIAARMRKMGINLVRFHHLDNPWSGSDGSLFIDGQGTRNLNPVTLDRLEYFIAALKAEGMYVNMNLNVSRTFSPLDGVAGADSLVDFGKAVTVFDPQLIDLQQEYAEQLLTHLNPYTGLPLTHDPVMAMVEIINENSIYGFWKGDRLRPFVQGGSLLQRHSDQLDSLWHAFLLNKYGSQSALETAWNTGAIPPGQGEQIQNGDFESGSMSPDWQIELHGGAQANIGTTSNNPFLGSQSGQITTTNLTGTDWHIQFKQVGMTVEADSTYAIQFAARADANVSLNVSAMRDNAPYTWYSGATYALTPSWQTFTFTFVAPEDNADFTRLSFSFDQQTAATYWLDEVSFAQPAQQGLIAGETLVQGNIARIPYSSRLIYTPQRIADQAEWTMSMQTAFYQEMKDFLKQDLNISVPITGTNALVGPQDVLPQADLDYVDDHSYWDHPWFPNQPWDPNDWQIANESLLKEPNGSAISGIFSGLAMTHKPYTVSEYNHPSPNRYQTEMMALLPAYASFQGADGLMIFEYSGDNTNWTEDRIPGYFSIQRNPALMSLMPTAAYAYRMGLIEEASTSYEIGYSADWVANTPQSDPNGRWGKYIPYDQRLALTHRIQTSAYQQANAPDFSLLPDPGSSPYFSSTGQLMWDTNLGLHKTAADRYVSLAGFLQDAPPTTAGALRLNDANGFGVVSWISLSDNKLEESERSLLTISSRAQNTGMIWQGNQTVNSNWGGAPTQLEPLTLNLRLHLKADSLRLLPLDEQGAISDSITLLPSSPDYFTLTIDQSQLATPWFGIKALGLQSSVSNERLEAIHWQVYPNPSSGQVLIQLPTSGTGNSLLQLHDLQGRLLGSWSSAGLTQVRLSLPDLPNGLYVLSLHGQGAISRKQLLLQR
ncbi:MAG: carbohydrate binding domain-containing protein [Bacteroidota bacterium]